MDSCVTEVNSLLQNSTLPTFTKRVLPVVAVYTAYTVAEWVIAGIVAALGVGTGYAAVKSVNLQDTSDDGVIGQLNSVVNASVIALATGTDHKIMASLTLSNPSPAPTGNVSERVHVEIATQDTADYKKGDIVVTVPKAADTKISDYLNMIGLEEAKVACQIPDSPETQSNIDKRMPPPLDDLNNLNEECRRFFREMAQMLRDMDEAGMQVLRPDNPANPLNPAQNPNGGAVPNINADGFNIAVQMAREWLERLRPGAIEAADLLSQAVVNLIIVIGHFTHTMITRYPEETLFLLLLPWITNVDSQVAGFFGSDILQTGHCKEQKTAGCKCEIVSMPVVHTVDQDFFTDVSKFTQELLNYKEEDPSCDSNNNLKLANTEFDATIAKGCQPRDELKRLKKRGPSGWEWSNIDDYGLQWGFDWNDKGEECDMDCEDMFDIPKNSDKCVWDNGGTMSKTGLFETDCGTASYSVHRPDAPQCWPGKVGAPRGKKEVDEEGGVGTSIDNAIVEFCNDIDGQKVVESVDVDESIRARRWAYSEWRVPDRKSFWLKAQYAPRPGCQGFELPHKTNCKAALRQGMDICGGSRTTGFMIHGIGCIDYSIHISDNTHEDSPPWKDPNIVFPPPNDAKYKNGDVGKAQCKGTKYNKISREDVDAGIASFCADGKEVTGWGWQDVKGLTNYPPEGQPQFYDNDPNQRYNLHMVLGAKIPEGQDPYQDPWCNGYDWKLGKDDCTYAFRRIWEKCSDADKSWGGTFLYRCLNYTSYPIQLEKKNWKRPGF